VIPPLDLPEPLDACASLPRTATFTERTVAAWLDAPNVAQRVGDFEAALRCCDQAEFAVIASE